MNTWWSLSSSSSSSWFSIYIMDFPRTSFSDYTMWCIPRFVHGTSFVYVYIRFAFECWSSAVVCFRWMMTNQTGLLVLGFLAAYSMYRLPGDIYSYSILCAVLFVLLWDLSAWLYIKGCCQVKCSIDTWSLEITMSGKNVLAWLLFCAATSLAWRVGQ